MKIVVQPNQPNITIQCFDLGLYINVVASVQQLLTITKTSSVHTSNIVFKLVPVKAYGNQLQCHETEDGRIANTIPLGGPPEHDPADRQPFKAKTLRVCEQGLLLGQGTEGKVHEFYDLSPVGESR